MTNREWLLKELASASDERLASIFCQNEPTVADDYGWEDNYNNPFAPRTREVTINSRLGFGSYKANEEYPYQDYDEYQKDFIEWLNAEHIEE